MSIPEQSGDSFDFCVLFRVYFTGKGAFGLCSCHETDFCLFKLDDFNNIFIRHVQDRK